MEIDSIVDILENSHSNEKSLISALSIVRKHIEYCIHYNIDMLTDPLLARVLKWK